MAIYGLYKANIQLLNNSSNCSVSHPVARIMITQVTMNQTGVVSDFIDHLIIYSSGPHSYFPHGSIKVFVGLKI